MSGNPFRRSKLPPPVNAPAESIGPASGPAIARINTDAANGASATPSKRIKKKRVTIVSPNSPEFAYRPADNERRRLSASDSAARAESPPPPPSAKTALDEREDETDSTTGDKELDEATWNTRQNLGSLPPSGIETTAVGGMRLPYNPFARTLATVEGINGLGTSSAQEEGAAGEQGVGRPVLDVDAFKNILMTGSAVPSPPTGRPGAVGIAPAATTSRGQDSGSNTDTSSLFDPRYNLHGESPRTSFDDYEDASDTDDGNENSTLMGEGRSDDIAPPAPPKPKSRGPQTVSFAEFEDSIPQGFQGRASQNQPFSAHFTGILRPSTPRSMSDLNKPLPPPPQEPSTAPEAADQPYSVRSALDESQGAAKKAPAPPPPPPPSRRKSGETGRARSASNLSNNTLDSVQSASVPQTQISLRPNEAASKLAPPPPPPSRKAHTSSRPSGTPSDPTSQDPSPSQSITDVPKAKPPPPPRRHPSTSGSIHSLANRTSESPRPAQRPGDAFLAAFTPANTPPAPPPRRGGSKRSSMDGPPDTLARRLSTEQHRRFSGGRTDSFDSERSASVGSLKQVPEPAEFEQAVVSPLAEEQRDVLADMSAFQDEIDALRVQSERTR
ncbi:hypothetical protein DOTSEDRAFT_74698 [Dothistroma septosporum NZE10]|uniref:Uncharacterized protein n=1 Tax=Dothistroma septosporum (strain NZE10 / CBS 128990) TaxID=675120 RepID=N1PCW4_DOTSN|nr:hypothetical protein DOTSEDRAFT_74698 [Dothistroma septosporum NZE10]